MTIKNLSNFRFFVKPCFICINQSWDSYDTDYGCGASYAICDADDYIYETWQENKKEFPYCESPKRCTRKNIFSFNSNFDLQDQCHYYSLLASMENSKDTNETAYRIAGSVSSFETRLRQDRGIK